MSPAVYFAVAAEARRLGLPLGGHLVTSLAEIDASDSGASIVDHLKPGHLSEHCFGHDASVERCQPIAERFRRNGTWVVPTLVLDAKTSGSSMVASQILFDRFLTYAESFWAGARLSHSHNWLRDSTGSAIPAVDSLGLLRIAHRVGLPILAGTDAYGEDVRKRPSGFWLHVELAMYVTNGLTPLEALQSATLNPAKYLKGSDSLGTVAPGKLADLVLLDANPLEDITNTTTIRAVVANGRYFDRETLDGLLAEVKTAEANAMNEP